ncbi:hypothetical protein KO465_01150 [Candidatus Micrarchaeota archaeon]|nr:hypothetical protein [Candidatus Micrarchaeota archaeon]
MNKKIFFCILIFGTLVFPTISYVNTLNGLPSNRDREGHTYEFSCILEKDGVLYVCDNYERRLYSLDWNKDILTREESWGSLNNLNKVIRTDTGHYILDSEYSDLTFFQKGRPGSKSFDDSWGPGSGWFVDIDIMGSKLLVLDRERAVIWKYNTLNYKYENIVCKKGEWDGYIDEPFSFYVEGEEIYIADRKNNRIQVVDIDCNFIKYYGRGLGGLNVQRPKFVNVNDYVFVLDSPPTAFRERIVVFDKTGYPIESFTDFGCDRYDKLGNRQQSKNCKIEDSLGMEVIKEGDYYYIFVMGVEYIDVFKFKDDRTRDDLYDRISEAERTLDEAEKLFGEAEKTFDYSYSLVNLKNRVDSASDSYSQKKYNEVEIYLKSVEEWIENSYPFEIEKIDLLIVESIEDISTNIANLRVTQDKEDTLELLLEAHTDANISYTDGALINAMENLRICYEYFDELNITIKKYSDMNQTNSEILEKIEKTNQTIQLYENKNNEYSLGLIFTSEKNYLDIAYEYYLSNDDELAEKTLDQINELLDVKKITIEEYTEKVNDSTYVIDDNYNKFEVLKNSHDIDFDDEELMFQEAYGLVKTYPEMAANMSTEAYESAEQKTKTPCFCGLPLVILFGCVLLVSRYE